jgi:hypothetical protein
MTSPSRGWIRRIKAWWTYRESIASRQFGGFRLFKSSRLSTQDKVRTVETKKAIPAKAAAISVPLGSPFHRSTTARYVMPVPTTTNVPRTNKTMFLIFTLRVILLAPERSFIGRIQTSIIASN